VLIKKNKKTFFILIEAQNNYKKKSIFFLQNKDSCFLVIINFFTNFSFHFFKNTFIINKLKSCL
jgi:hypothetical protein